MLTRCNGLRGYASTGCCAQARARRARPSKSGAAFLHVQARGLHHATFGGLSTRGKGVAFMNFCIPLPKLCCHPISFAVAQGVPKYEIGLGRMNNERGLVGAVTFNVLSPACAPLFWCWSRSLGVRCWTQQSRRMRRPLRTPVTTFGTSCGRVCAQGIPRRNRAGKGGGIRGLVFMDAGLRGSCV